MLQKGSVFKVLSQENLAKKPFKKEKIAGFNFFTPHHLISGQNDFNKSCCA